MIKKDDPKTSYNSVYVPLLRNGTYTRNVVRKVERQDNEEENELMIYKLINPAPRTPLVLIESHQVRGGLKRRRKRTGDK